MDFGESLAPISQVDVVSCRSDVIVIYRSEYIIFYMKKSTNLMRKVDSQTFYLVEKLFSFLKNIYSLFSVLISLSSENTYFIFIFRKRGYKEISRFPVEKWIPKEALTREGLEFIIMQKGCPEDSGQKIAMPDNGVFL